jgi:hypothetical protein
MRTRTRTGYLQFVVGAAINVAGAIVFLLTVTDALTRGG